ncbi:hypothetical protein UB32_17770 [Mesobacillus subterraneus]|uniref:Uncharacterized protein n=1 Tax=Mesobacillus subterraneus TaxID=285983 RepID=A0A0D6Z6M2_9BACI|nr:hypothetical protein UB32_17770 [Mesobacillus subterraneus]
MFVSCSQADIGKETIFGCIPEKSNTGFYQIMVINQIPLLIYHSVTKQYIVISLGSVSHYGNKSTEIFADPFGFCQFSVFQGRSSLLGYSLPHKKA